MRLLLACLVFSSLALGGTVQAQDYSGTYTTTNAAGGTVTLTLAQNAQGQVTGTLSAADVSYAVNGLLEDGSVLGTVSNQSVGLYFAAEFDEGTLYVTLFEPDANNQPNYASGQTIVFERTGGATPVPRAEPAPSPPKAADPAGTAGDVENALPLAFGLPRIIAVNAYLSRSLVVEAVYQATYLSGGAQFGRVVNTGTLAAGVGGVQYSPYPTDRLVVNLGQQTHEFVVTEAQGNSQAQTAAAWVMSPHVLRYTHKLPGVAEAEIAARYDGSRFDVQLQGWTMQSGSRYDVNLAASGQVVGVTDYHGQDVQTEYVVTGKISGSAVEIDVNEHHRSALAAATNLRILPSQRGSASRFNATINNVFRTGGVEYRLQNVEVQTDMSARGGQGQAGLTQLSGELLRAGQPFGRFLLQGGRGFVETGAGTIPLDPPQGTGNR